jgi:hypothetical protein
LIVDIQADLVRYSSLGVLDGLLLDQTTKANIIWGTDAHASLGEGYARDREITAKTAHIIRARAEKAPEVQTERTRQHAEVFTPLWICKLMNDHIDRVWFGVKKKNPFDAEKVFFRKGKRWTRYVDSKRLEITCGEAPFLVSRYDTASGEAVPIERRIGLLDRKLRVVNENAQTEAEWLKWAFRAVESVYGYEFQGDNLLIARVNVLATFEEALFARWNREPTEGEYVRLLKAIAFNLWQMDGLTGAPPYKKAPADDLQTTLFDEHPELEPPGADPTDDAALCVIADWSGHQRHPFTKLKEGKRAMKFDFIIGNPPYQEETDSDSTRKPPVYNYFMEECYKLADSVELITPARFLFNAGYTPKAWNEQMLNDEHLKIVYYEPNSGNIFPNVEIKGGIVITYRDSRQNYGAIETFTKYAELNDILKKVKKSTNTYMDSIIYATLSFKLSDKMMMDHPDSIGRLRTSAFTNLAEIFYESEPDDEHEYIAMIGLYNNKRVRRYVRRDYIVDGSGTLDKYSLLMPNASGAGEYGERLSASEIAKPGEGFLQTFNAFGAFPTVEPVQNIDKYIKTKFARSLLGVLKITQHLPAPKWKYVPLQDFTPASDIDWSRSIPEIDRQLYAKYGLTDAEIEFIETHVKEMA